MMAWEAAATTTEVLAVRATEDWVATGLAREATVSTP